LINVQSAGPQPTWHYAMYGMRVRSAFPLSGWPPIEKIGDLDVDISRAELSGPAVIGGPYSVRTLAEGGDLRIGVGGVGRYWATGGAHIRVDPDPAARSEDVELYLTGALMGAILHQRGVFPLHASCVALGGDAIAFAGDSGAGKSTLLAALGEAGATFVTDDTTVVAPENGNGLAVWPGPLRMKLDPRGLAALAREANDLKPAGGTRGKYQVPVRPTGDGNRPVPLRRIYLLAEGEGPPRVEPLEGLEAISAVVDATYFLGFATLLGLSSQIFRGAASVARHAKVAKLIRPRGLEFLPATIQLIQSEARRS
jgi:hypothetical protein